MSSLRQKLLITIGLILLSTQLISALWVWKEAQEQVSILVDETLEEQKRNDKIEHELRETIAALLLPSVLMVGVSLVFIFITITKLTQPLNRLTRQLELRSSNNLQPIFESNNTSLEVFAITQKLNELFERIELGVENERRFTADVAHELRTPLAGLRLNLELLPSGDFPEAGLLVARVDQMIVSVEQLLQLSRAGQKLLSGQAQQIDLIEDVISPLQMELEEDVFPHPLLWQVPEQAKMIGDSGLIFVLLRNLLENIRRYAPESRQTIVKLSQNQRETLLEVLDEGSGIPEEQLKQLTGRFFRIDERKKGYGLGLNIVERIVQAHQGTLTLQNRKDQTGFHVIVRFPSISLK